MKVFKVRSIIIIALVIICFLVCSLGGCKSNSLKSRFTMPTFGQENERASDGALVCDVISKELRFNVNEISLNLYYGYIEGASLAEEFSSENKVYKFVSIALYFQNVSHDYVRIGAIDVDNYKQIDNMFFIKEMDYNDFYQELYKVKVTKKWGQKKLTYNYHEELSVNSQLFDDNIGSFAFCARAIYSEETSGQYQLDSVGYVTIYYEHLNENTVRLSTFPIN